MDKATIFFLGVLAGMIIMVRILHIDGTSRTKTPLDRIPNRRE